MKPLSRPTPQSGVIAAFTRLQALVKSHSTEEGRLFASNGPLILAVLIRQKLTVLTRPRGGDIARP